MKRMPFCFLLVHVCCAFAWLWFPSVVSAAAQDEPPVEWIEQDTGHRVARLSREPGSQSLYFHEYPYSADGKKLVFTSRQGIQAVNLLTREISQVVEGQARVLVTGRKTGNIYYLRGSTVHATDLNSLESRQVAELPARFGNGNFTVNADESLIVALGRDPDGQAAPRTPPSNHTVDSRITGNWAAGRPMLLYTVDVKTGEARVLHRSNDWLNHLQCSPTDPQQIMFCHEGPWHFVDRIWRIRTDGSKLTSVHPRTVDMEIAGHEFFSQDGKAVWYDLQTPRSIVFWLARYDVATGARHWYHVERTTSSGRTGRSISTSRRTAS
jgi:oligogalacturonide lyase